MRKSKRIFIGLSETSGYYGRLYCGLRELGIDCCFAQIYPNKHSYQYKMEERHRIVRFCKKMYSKNDMLFVVGKVLLFIWALLRYDTFVFTGCESFWNGKELPIYKMLNKKVVMMCLGWKTRLPYANGPDIELSRIDAIGFQRKMLHEVQVRQAEIDIIEKYADVFINSSAQAQLNKKAFYSISYLGIPIDFQDEYVEKPKEQSRNTVRILHAASYLGWRGTKEFKQCIEKLKEKYDIEYIELTGVPNQTVIEEIKKCDFVLDELWSDTPMATFAAEAAYYGKPAIVCSYFADGYKKYYPKGSCPPSMFILPDDILQGIERMIVDVDYRMMLGQKAQHFVKKYLNSQSVARRFYKMINGDIDGCWIVNPLEMGYIEGYGVDKEVQKRLIRNLYDQYGIEKMGVMHNDNLKNRVLEIVSEGKENR